MFLDDTQKQNGAASQNEAPGDAAIAGAAPRNKTETAAPAPAEVAIPPELEKKILELVGRLVTNEVGLFMFANPPTLGNAERDRLIGDCEAIAVSKAMEISEQSKADTIAGVNMLLKPILDWFQGKKDAPAPAGGDPGVAAAVPHAIGEGDQVKVWTDSAKKNFMIGVVQEVHDDGHSFDVRILSSGDVTHVQAGGLALDELAS